MEFKVGDKTVYPGHGVGVVRNVVTMDFDGYRQTFYVVKILDNGMTIKVPQHLNVGDKVKVDTRDDTFVEKV